MNKLMMGAVLLALGGAVTAHADPKAPLAGAATLTRPALNVVAGVTPMSRQQKDAADGGCRTVTTSYQVYVPLCGWVEVYSTHEIICMYSTN